MKLPSVYNIPKYQTSVQVFRGVNYSDNLAMGDLVDCKGLSMDRYPFLHTNNYDRLVEHPIESDYVTPFESVTNFTSWDGVFIWTTLTRKVYYGIQQVTGTLPISLGKKQFAVIGDKVCIFPDKVYFTKTDLTLIPMGYSKSVSYNVTITVGTPGDNLQSTQFDFGAFGSELNKIKVGDTVVVRVPAPIGGRTEWYGTVKELVSDMSASLPIYKIYFTDNVFSDLYSHEVYSFSSQITIAREVPDLDYICESNNRLWGVSNTDHTIYASALGDPLNFKDYRGISVSSYAAAVASENNFTGICAYGSSVLCWKEHKLHKVLGSYPAEYTVYAYDMEGLKDGSFRSMEVVDGILYLHGVHGVLAYNGSTTTLLSQFGNRQFYDAVAVSDGEKYYLNVKEDTGGAYPVGYRFAYYIRTGMWLKEADWAYDDATFKNGKVYGTDISMRVYEYNCTLDKTNLRIGNDEWYAQFAPFYETIKGRKQHTKLIFRLAIPEGHMEIKIRIDNGKWQTIAKLHGSNERTQTIRIPLTRGDKFDVRLEGKGQCVIKEMLREYSVGGEQ